MVLWTKMLSARGKVEDDMSGPSNIVSVTQVTELSMCRIYLMQNILIYTLSVYMCGVCVGGEEEICFQIHPLECIQQ